MRFGSRDMLLTSGTLSYQGDWNAALNLRVRGRVRNVEEQRDYDVTIALTGSTEDADLSFSSDPPESEARIVSLVTTGHFGSAGFESGGRAMGDQLTGLFASRMTRGACAAWSMRAANLVRPRSVPSWSGISCRRPSPRPMACEGIWPVRQNTGAPVA